MMSDEYLHARRAFELQSVVKSLPAFVPGQTPVRVLEIGAGTGQQAAILDELGYQVTAVDLPSGAYTAKRVYPVMDYDGVSLPVEDSAIDIVFSSNVLEHVTDVTGLLRETRRVLTPDGLAIHVLPTTTWRLWSTMVHPLWVVKRSVQVGRGRPLSNRSTDGRDQLVEPRSLWWSLIPRKHGERGNALTEAYYFSVGWWSSLFEGEGFRIIESRPAGLFYTGGKILGPRLSIPARSRLARMLGSSCWIYVLSVR